MEQGKDQKRYLALEGIYLCYDEYVRDFPSACEPGCATCCTTNVLATSLEVEYLLKGAGRAGLELPWDGITAAVKRGVYRPALTTNEVADLCLRQQEVPQDPGEHAPGACPMLTADKTCMVYEYRPFSCRAMTSASRCSADGEAEMDQFLVSVNLAVYQIIEHLDLDGAYGNLLDLLLMSRGEGVEGLLTNRRLPGFLVRPWETRHFERFLLKLYRFEVKGEKLGDLLGIE